MPHLVSTTENPGGPVHDWAWDWEPVPSIDRVLCDMVDGKFSVFLPFANLDIGMSYVGCTVVYDISLVAEGRIDPDHGMTPLRCDRVVYSDIEEVREFLERLDFEWYVSIATYWRHCPDPISDMQSWRKIWILR